MAQGWSAEQARALREHVTVHVYRADGTELDVKPEITDEGWSFLVPEGVAYVDAGTYSGRTAVRAGDTVSARWENWPLRADDFAGEDTETVARERQHWLDQLRTIPQRRAELAEDEQAIVRQARMAGFSWDDIAAAIGHEDNITVQEKYGEPEPGEEPF